MSNRDWEELVRLLPAGADAGEAPRFAEITGLASERTPAQADLGQLSHQVAQTILLQPAAPIPATSSQRSTQVKEGPSTAETIGKTAGMVTGLGPLVTGLMKLFGSSGEVQSPAPLVPFLPPASVSVEAGLSADRQFTAISYGQNGIARPQAPTPGTSAPQVNITVQAMDSRSFLDHSEDIARAVRDAMLHSHSLNDVVAEL
jgi:hypothetical protein